MKFLLPLLIALSMVSVSSAGVLTRVDGEQKLADVPVAKSASVQTSAGTANLTAVGAGLRSKKVLFVNVKVYVGQLFVASPESFKKSEALASVKDQNAVAMQMTFVREVDLGRIESSFEESFKVNNIDLKDPAIHQFMEAVHKGGDVQKGKTITVVASKKDKADLITFEGANGQTSEISGEGLAPKIFSLWLEKTADSGVSDFQKSLLQ